VFLNANIALYAWLAYNKYKKELAEYRPTTDSYYYILHIIVSCVHL